MKKLPALLIILVIVLSGCCASKVQKEIYDNEQLITKEADNEYADILNRIANDRTISFKIDNFTVHKHNGLLGQNQAVMQILTIKLKSKMDALNVFR